MIRVSNNFASATAIANLRRINDQQAKLQQNVASGRRLLKPSDDPAATSRVLNHKMEQERVSNYRAAASMAKSASEASLAALKQLQKISGRMGELSSLAAGVDPQSMRAYGAEVAQLLEQAANVANTRFGPDYIFAGTAVDAAPYEAVRADDGTISRVAYKGNNTDSLVPIGDGRAISPSAGAATTNPAIAEFMNRMVALRDAMKTANASAVKSINSQMAADEDKFITAIGTVAAVQARIESNETQLQARSNDLGELIARDTDADLATTMVQLNQAQTAYQAALSSTANIFKSSLLDYLR
jgi:flagellar hook-associated protein 3 FlgL